MKTIDRKAYAEMYGPTTGDRVRLGDTDLYVEIERDHTDLRRGGEVRRRQGDPRRHGPEPAHRARRRRHGDHQRRHPGRHGASSRPTSGSRTGASARIGKAGNPDVQPGVDRHHRPGHRDHRRRGLLPHRGRRSTPTSTSSRPSRCDDALMSGVTTMFGGGTGPAAGTNATTCTPGPWYVARMLQAAEALPMNLGFLGKGNASRPEGAGRADPRRLRGPQAARGLGHDARPRSTAA